MSLSLILIPSKRRLPPRNRSRTTARDELARTEIVAVGKLSPAAEPDPAARVDSPIFTTPASIHLQLRRAEHAGVIREIDPERLSEFAGPVTELTESAPSPPNPHRIYVDRRSQSTHENRARFAL
jgi:hypothetical protein